MGDLADDVNKHLSNYTNTNDNDDSEYEDTNDGLRGPTLYEDSLKICTEKLADTCASEMTVMKLLYSQQIKSDCVAYENALKKRDNESLTKLNIANSELQRTALEQNKSANKYNLGECTVEFKKCMKTTAECGADFSKCAESSALKRLKPKSKNNYYFTETNNNEMFLISGPSTDVEIYADFYDVLESKRPMCDSVTKQCSSVAGQVWNTFLRESAAELKMAEMIAENNVRTSCISDISKCFERGCKDNIDPKDPDGSYNMCLTRPESMLSLCRPEMEKCGIDATNADTASESKIWDFVVARLAAMRVDACTREVRECLTDQNRCGPDYSQCIGLDTDTIIRMCPYDKLTGCQQVYQGREILGESVYDELSTMVSGIMVNIDSRALEHCQNALNNSMINVCGNLENCNSIIIDKYASGTKSLEYKICEYAATDKDMKILFDKCVRDVSMISDADLGRVEGSTTGELGPVRPLLGVMDGAIYWNEINADANGKITTPDQYLQIVGIDEMSEQSIDRIRTEIDDLQMNISKTISAIESDPTVQYCMTGREIPGFEKFTGGDVVPRFPNLSQQTRLLIANAALDATRENYYKHYDKNQDRMMADYVTMAERQAEIRGANGRDVRREAARQSCVALAEQSSLPKSPPPPKNLTGIIIIGILLVAATVVTSVLTMGLTTGLGAAVLSGIAQTFGVSIATGTVGSFSAANIAATVIASTAIGVSGATAFGLGANAAMGNSTAQTQNTVLELHGEFKLEQHNYRETITTDFDWDTLKCHKCSVTQVCEDEANPWFGQKHCKKWGDESEPECRDIQF